MTARTHASDERAVLAARLLPLAVAPVASDDHGGTRGGLQCLEIFLDSADAATRLAGLRTLARVCEQPQNAAALQAFGALARLMGLLTGPSAGTLPLEPTLAALQAARFDRVKPVRDAVMDAIALLRELHVVSSCLSFLSP